MTNRVRKERRCGCINALSRATEPVKRRGAEGESVGFDPLASGRECSLDAMEEAGAGQIPTDGSEGLEDAVVDRMLKDARIEILRGILPGLTKEEKRMLTSITDDISSRRYEEMYGVPRRTILDRRSKLLNDL